ncbi:L-ascorbate metabolism protein UlaG (beta-lactamase superfamily) [Friedmanniella endophytica]|uniref:L-ascorbate metabolism protein UlaG (Beta-lactamase superfamily) n=1 Tax=Microlunatus kandeliicorticis TaxID=1759536 RepID=A0A7W3ISG4_9ACTN|nr:MBL fold metallo-hydrolase [Microlunatus kandeliicorticis]MBA8794335.1 L-ascorbate metabolism protein UlaG (beta-lactamase superfamily) [Microlunatus kandeliicorticis]
MQITHLGHAAVLVETDGARILIDPGNLSDGAWARETDLDAVLVTHLHPDHLDPQTVPALLAANPGAHVVVEPSILDLIEKGELPALHTDAGPAEALAPGDTVSVGGLRVTAVGGRHAVIHADLPRIGNVGYLLAAEGEPTLFHPGDAYDTAPEGVDVLALPAYGPWAALKETIDFARAVGAPRGFPIHDELLNDRGRGLVTGRVNDMTGTELTDLRGQGPQRF